MKNKKYLKPLFGAIALGLVLYVQAKQEQPSSVADQGKQSTLSLKQLNGKLYDLNRQIQKATGDIKEKLQKERDTIQNQINEQKKSGKKISAQEALRIKTVDPLKANR